MRKGKIAGKDKGMKALVKKIMSDSAGKSRFSGRTQKNMLEKLNHYNK